MTENTLTRAIKLNQAGIAAFEDQKWEEAAHAFEAALDARPDYLDAYYNLGLALQRLGRIEMASHAFEAAIQLFPTHLGAQFQLGCFWMSRKEYVKAITHFQVIEAAYPEHAETYVNLGTCHLKQGQLVEAKRYYLQALSLLPDEAQALFNLGVIYTGFKQYQDAITCYQQLLRVEPLHYAARHNLGSIYLTLRQTPAALFHFQEALRVEPDHPEVQYMVRMLTGPDQGTTPPETYLRLLFEGYADHYETHLAQLEDHTPEALCDLVKSVLGERKLESMLDIGCGTGRCGVHFRSLVMQLVGVDLSAAMLQVAAEKKLYDALHEADMIAYLTQHAEHYDLILAGDVLVYQGALETLFHLLVSRLKPQGLFAFSVEVSNDADYRMQPSGRFAHHPRYIAACAQTHGLACLRSQRLSMGGREVSLYVMTLIAQ